jgi:hypothetical protein
MEPSEQQQPQDNSKASSQQAADVSASPTDTRFTAAAVESDRGREGRNPTLTTGESFQSTDTVRRRPEGGYGMFNLDLTRIVVYMHFIIAIKPKLTPGPSFFRLHSNAKSKQYEF